MPRETRFTFFLPPTKACGIYSQNKMLVTNPTLYLSLRTYFMNDPVNEIFYKFHRILTNINRQYVEMTVMKIVFNIPDA